MNQQQEASASVESDSAAGRYRISGVLNHQTVAAIEHSQFVSGDDGVVHIDLSAVRFADSTAVALMLGWVQQIRDGGSRVRFEAIPTRLRALIEITGLTSVFDHER